MMTVEQSKQSTPKLDLFVLPSQTTVLFAIIVLVFLAAVLSGVIGPSPICVTPVLVGIVLLPLRAYLAWPDREIEQYALRSADEFCVSLQVEIRALSERIGLRPLPHLMITDRPLGIYTFGSFRRRYVGMDVNKAQALMIDLASPASVERARAVLLHELGHFRNSDVWQMGYAHELMRTVALFLSWSAVFFVGMILLMMVSIPAYLRADLSQVPGLDPSLKPLLELLLRLDPASRAEIAQRASQVNLGLVASFVFNSLGPMIAVGAVVWAFYWRKLLRVRELYADARAAQSLGSALPVQQAIVDYGVGLPPPTSRSLRPRPLPQPAPAREFDVPLAFGGDTLQALWRLHPRLIERLECLRDPSRVLGSWWNTALVVGILVLLLDVLLVSPFTAYYLSTFPMHFATLTAFVVVAVSLLPNIAQGKRLSGDIARIVAVVVALRFGWLAFNIIIAAIVYVISPDALAAIFETVVHTSSRSASALSGRVIGDAGQLLSEAALGQAAFLVVIGLALLACLFVDTWLKRRAFTWYGCKRIVLVCWAITGLLAFLVGTTVLVPLTALIMGAPKTLLHPVSLSLIALAILTASAGMWMFVRGDRRYSRRCPRCGTRVAGDYDSLGKRCPRCGEVFHPWLIASY